MSISRSCFSVKWFTKILYLKVKFIYKGQRDLYCRIDWHYIGQIYGGDFAKLCGLLLIYELYVICTLGKSRNFRESVNELEISMQDQKSKPICCEDYFASFFSILKTSWLLRYVHTRILKFYVKWQFQNNDFSVYHLAWFTFRVTFMTRQK